MSKLQKFTPEEIRALHTVPFWVFYQVAGADSNIDEEEIASFKSVLKDAPQLRDEFAREILVDMNANFDNVVLKSKAEEPMKGLLKAMDILSRKSSPSECEELKMLVFVMGWTVAAASGEFSETGEGSNISDDEIANLTRIADVLGLSMVKLRKVITSNDGVKIWRTFLKD